MNDGSGTDERSAHTYDELPSLKREDNDIPLLLIWSAKWAGRALSQLQTWVISDKGKREYYKLIEALDGPKDPAEIGLILGALKSLTEIFNLGGTTSPSKGQFVEFYDIMDGFHARNAPATLGYMISCFARVMLLGDDSDERLKIFSLLSPDTRNLIAHVKASTHDSMPLPDPRDISIAHFYWQLRCKPLRSHHATLSYMSIEGQYLMSGDYEEIPLQTTHPEPSTTGTIVGLLRRLAMRYRRSTRAKSSEYVSGYHQSRKATTGSSGQL